MTFEVLFTLVNKLHMSHIFLAIEETLSTIFTLEIADFLMSFLIVTFQCIIDNKGFRYIEMFWVLWHELCQNISSKSLVTKFAFEILLLSKNFLNVPFASSFDCEFITTNVTLKILFVLMNSPIIFLQHSLFW